MPIFIEFLGLSDEDKAHLSDDILYHLEQEIGLKVEKAFPMDKKSLTLKVTFDDE